MSRRTDVDSIWYWVASGVIIIATVLMMWVNPNISCAVGFCHSQICWSNVNCGPECFCLKRSGQTSGECYQR